MAVKKGGYAVPKKIRDMRPQGTEVKKIKGRYYVYEARCVKDGATGKWKKVSGKKIGSIDPAKGFLPNGESVSSTEVTCVDFGAEFLLACAADPVFMKLSASYCYADCLRLFVLGATYVAKGYQPIRDLAARIEPTLFGLLSSASVKWGESAMGSFLHDLGARRSKTEGFMQSLADSNSGKVAIDTHSIASFSELNCLAGWGWKHDRVGGPQINFLMAYDSGSGMPIYSDAVEGSTVDKASVESMFEAVSFKNTLFLADQGYYSDANKALLSKDGCTYIMPVPANRRSFKKATASLPFSGQFLYRKKGKVTVVRWFEPIPLSEGGERVLVFRDEAQNQADCASYLDCLQRGEKGFSEGKYAELSPFFGVYVLGTNRGGEAEQVFRDYKDRWPVETFYDWFANDADLRALGLQDFHAVRGMATVFLVAGMIRCELLHLLAEKARSVSVREALALASYLKSEMRGGSWHVSNKKKKAMDLFASLGIEVPATLDEFLSPKRKVMIGKAEEKGEPKAEETLSD